MMYNEDIESLLNKIEAIISKDYDEQLALISANYEKEIIRLNTVIEAYKELLKDAQK